MKLRFLESNEIIVVDKYTKEHYKNGNIYEFKEERAKELLKFKYNGKPIVEKVKETKKSKTTE